MVKEKFFKSLKEEGKKVIEDKEKNSSDEENSEIFPGGKGEGGLFFRRQIKEEEKRPNPLSASKKDPGI